MGWGGDGKGQRDGKGWGGGRGSWGAPRQEELRVSHGAAAAGPLAESSAPLQSVHLDALVYLQIMKHCNQQPPGEVANGQLLGLDVDDTLEVTHSFGYLASEEGFERDRRVLQGEGGDHSMNMKKQLRDVNVDSYIAGWYSTSHLGQFLSGPVVDAQYEMQCMVSRSVLLVYDPLQAAIGKPAFRAVQLTREFMKLYDDSSPAAREKLAELPSSQMVVEIPVSVTASALAESFLMDWAMADPLATTSQVAVLDVENQAFLEKNVQLLSESLERLSNEQMKLMNFERNMSRKGDEKGKGKDFRRQAPPQPVDTLIISQQIKQHCKAINDFSGDAFGKIYLMSNKPASAGKAD